MAIRVHEVHPSLVHFPLALFPASLALDVVGRMTRSPGLMEAGRRLMPAAVVSAVAAGLAGLVAQQAVRAEGRAHATLATHRNLNLLLTGLAVVLARTRWRTRRPGWTYLLTGLGGVAAMNYTAYLGGKMVYTHGVGVEPAAGVRLEDSPEIRRGSAGKAARLSAAQATRGVVRTAREIGSGELAPLLQHRPHRRAWQSREQRESERRARGDGARQDEEPLPMTGYGGTQGGYGSSFYGRGEDKGLREGRPKSEP